MAKKKGGFSSKPQPEGMNEKLGTIVEYIENELREKGLKDPRRIPCPSKDDWQRLAAGQYPVLPSIASLGIWASAEVHKAAKKASMHQAYFAAAQELILKKQAA